MSFIDLPPNAAGDAVLVESKQITPQGSIPVIDSAILIEGFEAVTGVTANSDVTNIALSTEHRGVGQYSVSFDKSGATQPYALIEKTIDSVDLSSMTGSYDIEFSIKIPDITDVSLVYVAMGSSIANNIYWQTSVADLVNGWNILAKELLYPESQIGAGIDYANVTWIGIYIGFNAAGDTLAGMKVDNIELHSSSLHRLDDIVTASQSLLALAQAPKDYRSEVSLGNVAGRSSVHKHGNAPSGIQTTLTDIWPRADATPTQQIWLAPTAARIHTIASTSAQDNTGGTGTDTVIVTYLATWASAEADETVTGNLNAGIAMSASAVMINRIKCIPQASSTSANVGTITATAAVDATITAVVLPGKGKTRQAIYGVPSGYKFLLDDYSASMNDNNAQDRIDVELLMAVDPANSPTIFRHDYSFEIQNSGSSRVSKEFSPPLVCAGPCIVKVSGTGNINDIDCSAGMDGVLVQDGF